MTLTPERLQLLREWVRPSDGSRPKLCHNSTADELLAAHDASLARERTLREVLVSIAAYSDAVGNRRLAAGEGYGSFDEPTSVERARNALATKEPS